jgi:hypothetical protein
MAGIDATLEEQVIDLPPRDEIADVDRFCEANHLMRAVEIAEGIAHRRRLLTCLARLNLIWSDKAAFI